MLKLITILGARPQFVKAAVVSRAIVQHNRAGGDPQIHEMIVHTGQHFDDNMSGVFFEQMAIPEPSLFLNINQMGHGEMTGRMLEAIEPVLINNAPDLVLVYGDTNSTLAGALTAAKLHIPIAHVEAGLRSYNRRMPEEHNRVLTDHLSFLLFCPTQQAVDNLKREGLSDYPVAEAASGGMAFAPRIHRVGDVMYDAALFYRSQARTKASVARSVIKDGIPGRAFALVTLHRQENTDDQETLGEIASALIHLSETLPVIWPMHPRTRHAIDALGPHVDLDHPNLIIVDPVSYFDMLGFLESCSIVLTDSGGLQKEAYFFNKPCVTMRKETEWVELVEHGVNQLVGSNPGQIRKAAFEMLDSKLKFDQDLYGSGDSGTNIVSIIATAFPKMHSSQDQ